MSWIRDFIKKRTILFIVRQSIGRIFKEVKGHHWEEVTNSAEEGFGVSFQLSNLQLNDVLINEEILGCGSGASESNPTGTTQNTENEESGPSTSSKSASSASGTVDSPTQAGGEAPASAAAAGGEGKRPSVPFRFVEGFVDTIHGTLSIAANGIRHLRVEGVHITLDVLPPPPSPPDEPERASEARSGSTNRPHHQESLRSPQHDNPLLHSERSLPGHMYESRGLYDSVDGSPLFSSMLAGDIHRSDWETNVLRPAMHEISDHCPASAEGQAEADRFRDALHSDTATDMSESELFLSAISVARSVDEEVAYDQESDHDDVPATSQNPGETESGSADNSYAGTWMRFVEEGVKVFEGSIRQTIQSVTATVENVNIIIRVPPPGKTIEPGQPLPPGTLELLVNISGAIDMDDNRVSPRNTARPSSEKFPDAPQDIIVIEKRIRISSLRVALYPASSRRRVINASGTVEESHLKWADVFAYIGGNMENSSSSEPSPRSEIVVTLTQEGKGSVGSSSTAGSPVSNQPKSSASGSTDLGSRGSIPSQLKMNVYANILGVHVLLHPEQMSNLLCVGLALNEWAGGETKKDSPSNGSGGGSSNSDGCERTRPKFKRRKGTGSDDAQKSGSLVSWDATRVTVHCSALSLTMLRAKCDAGPMKRVWTAILSGSAHCAQTVAHEVSPVSFAQLRLLRLMAVVEPYSASAAAGGAVAEAFSTLYDRYGDRNISVGIGTVDVWEFSTPAQKAGMERPPCLSRIVSTSEENAGSAGSSRRYNIALVTCSTTPLSSDVASQHGVPAGDAPLNAKVVVQHTLVKTTCGLTVFWDYDLLERLISFAFQMVRIVSDAQSTFNAAKKPISKEEDSEGGAGDDKTVLYSPMLRKLSMSELEAYETRNYGKRGEIRDQGFSRFNPDPDGTYASPTCVPTTGGGEVCITTGLVSYDGLGMVNSSNADNSEYVHIGGPPRVCNTREAEEEVVVVVVRYLTLQLSELSYQLLYPVEQLPDADYNGPHLRNLFRVLAERSASAKLPDSTTPHFLDARGNRIDSLTASPSEDQLRGHLSSVVLVRFCEMEVSACNGMPITIAMREADVSVLDHFSQTRMLVTRFVLPHSEKELSDALHSKTPEEFFPTAKRANGSDGMDESSFPVSVVIGQCTPEEQLMIRVNAQNCSAAAASKSESDDSDDDESYASTLGSLTEDPQRRKANIMQSAAPGGTFGAPLSFAAGSTAVKQHQIDKEQEILKQECNYSFLCVLRAVEVDWHQDDMFLLLFTSSEFFDRLLAALDQWSLGNASADGSADDSPMHASFQSKHHASNTSEGSPSPVRLKPFSSRASTNEFFRSDGDFFFSNFSGDGALHERTSASVALPWGVCAHFSVHELRAVLRLPRLSPTGQPLGEPLWSCVPPQKRSPAVEEYLYHTYSVTSYQTDLFALYSSYPAQLMKKSLVNLAVNAYSVQEDLIDPQRIPKSEFAWQPPHASEPQWGKHTLLAQSYAALFNRSHNVEHSQRNANRCAAHLRVTQEKNLVDHIAHVEASVRLDRNCVHHQIAHDGDQWLQVLSNFFSNSDDPMLPTKDASPPSGTATAGGGGGGGGVGEEPERPANPAGNGDGEEEGLDDDKASSTGSGVPMAMTAKVRITLKDSLFQYQPYGTTVKVVALIPKLVVNVQKDPETASVQMKVGGSSTVYLHNDFIPELLAYDAEAGQSSLFGRTQRGVGKDLEALGFVPTITVSHTGVGCRAPHHGAHDTVDEAASANVVLTLNEASSKPVYAEVKHLCVDLSFAYDSLYCLRLIAKHFVDGTDRLYIPPPALFVSASGLPFNYIHQVPEVDDGVDVYVGERNDVASRFDFLMRTSLVDALESAAIAPIADERRDTQLDSIVSSKRAQPVMAEDMTYDQHAAEQEHFDLPQKYPPPPLPTEPAGGDTFVDPADEFGTDGSDEMDAWVDVMDPVAPKSRSVGRDARGGAYKDPNANTNAQDPAQLRLIESTGTLDGFDIVDFNDYVRPALRWELASSALLRNPVPPENATEQQQQPPTSSVSTMTLFYRSNHFSLFNDSIRRTSASNSQGQPQPVLNCPPIRTELMLFECNLNVYLWGGKDFQDDELPASPTQITRRFGFQAWDQDLAEERVGANQQHTNATPSTSSSVEGQPEGFSEHGPPAAGSRSPLHSQRGRPDRIVGSRNKHESIVGHFAGISLQVDMFVPGKSKASQVLLSVKDGEVLDLIEGSSVKTMMMCSVPRHMRDNDSKLLEVRWTTLLPGGSGVRHGIFGKPEESVSLRLQPVTIAIHRRALDLLPSFIEAPGLESEPSTLFFNKLFIHPVQLTLYVKLEGRSLRSATSGDIYEICNYLAPAVERACVRVPPMLISSCPAEQVAEQILVRLKDEILNLRGLFLLLCGVQPVHLASDLSSAATDILFLPLEQLRKHRSLFAGVSRGLRQFLVTLTSETLHVASDATQYVHTLTNASTALAMNSDERQPLTKGVQPVNATQGLQNALAAVMRGFHESSQHAAYCLGPDGKPLQLPLAATALLDGLVRGLTEMLRGMRNSLAPEQYAWERKLFK